ncbi:MAG: FAD-binding protein [Actinomycetota bacterium]|nr:FAD-binding protein [Actinomycetota bacterium]
MAGGEAFPGATIGRDDARWETMIRGFNLRWVANPDRVQVCGDAGQVLATVQRAYDEGKRITVRSGGHCYEDFVCDNEGGVLIDLSPMNGVRREGTSKLFCVEGGATLWNVYNALYRDYGVTLPAGSCYAVGAGGHFTGGGYGLLSRLHGLTSDYLAAVELVRVDSQGKAELVRVGRDSSSEEEREIFWAHTGGGGGNFGIVTKFWFEDPPPAPKTVWLASLAWDWKKLSETDFSGLIQRYGDWHVANSDPGSRFAPLFALLHLNQMANESSQIVLTVQVADDNEALLREFAGDVAGGLPPVSGEPRSIQWLFATQLLDGMNPNEWGKYKSAYMNEGFPPHQIEALWRHLREKPNEAAAQALLQVDSYGCQVNSVAPDATAVAQRSSVMKLQYQTYWNNEVKEGRPKDMAKAEKENLDWIRGFYEDMYGANGPMPNGTMDGCFVNYPDGDLKDWQYLYYKDNYPRLRRAKSFSDPLDVFHHQQSIELAE